MHKTNAVYTLLFIPFVLAKAQTNVPNYPPCTTSCWNDTLEQMNIDARPTEIATGIKVCGNTAFDINLARCIGNRCGAAELNATAADVEASCQDTDTPLNITEEQFIAAGLPILTPKNQTMSNNNTITTNDSSTTDPNVSNNPSTSENGNCNDVSGTNISVQGCSIESRASGNGRPLSNGEIAGIIVAVVTLLVTIPTGWLACKKILQKRQISADEMTRPRTTSTQSNSTNRHLVGTLRSVSGMSMRTESTGIVGEEHLERQTLSPYPASPPPSFPDSAAV